MNTFSDFEEAYKRLVKIDNDKRIDSILSHNDHDPSSLDRVINLMGLHLTCAKHMKSYQVIISIFSFLFLAMMVLFASQKFPSKIYIIPVSIVILITCASTIPRYHNEVFRALKSLQELTQYVTYYIKFADGLDKLDEFLRQPATIRKPEDVQLILDQEMKKIATMANALINTWGDVGARNNHNYVELRASAKQLGAIARSLGYTCQSFDDALISNSISSYSPKKT